MPAHFSFYQALRLASLCLKGKDRFMDETQNRDMTETLALTAAPLISQASARLSPTSDRITRVGSATTSGYERLARIVTDQVIHNAGGETIGSVMISLFNRQGQYQHRRHSE
jgi:hypothetical protein